MGVRISIKSRDTRVSMDTSVSGDLITTFKAEIKEKRPTKETCIDQKKRI